MSNKIISNTFSRKGNKVEDVQLVSKDSLNVDGTKEREIIYSTNKIKQSITVYNTKNHT